MRIQASTAEDRRIYQLHAAVCQTLANARRLEIIERLRPGEQTVGELAEALGISQPNVSQHLALMRRAGIVIARREGLNVWYRVSSPKIFRACALMRELLLENLAAGGRLVEARSR
jgi:ArsR family transcriptional regulator